MTKLPSPSSVPSSDEPRSAEAPNLLRSARFATIPPGGPRVLGLKGLGFQGLGFRV